MKTNLSILNFSKFTIFILQGIFISLVVLLCLIFVNYKLDISNIYESKEYYDNISKKLINDKKNIVVQNIDHVYLKINLLNLLKEKKKNIDNLIIGSSRVWSISSFSSKDNNSFTFNMGIPNGRLRDYTSIIYKTIKQNNIKTILFGIYPDIFLIENKKLLFNHLRKNYIKYTKKVDLKNSDNSFYAKLYNNKYYNLISPSYFKNSIHFYLNKKLYLNEIKIINNNNQKQFNGFMLNPNGTLIPPKGIREKSGANFKPFSKMLLKDHLYRKISAEIWKEFKILINYLINNNVQIIIYLPPFHPDLYNLMKTDDSYNYAIIVENKLRSFFKDKSIEIISSYNPNILNLEKEDFYDHVHLKTKGVKKIFDQKVESSKDEK